MDGVDAAAQEADDSAEMRRLRGEVRRLRMRVADLELAHEREQAARHESEARAEQALQRSYEVDRVKSDFLSTVSHELRTPLTSITGFITLLREHGDRFDENQRADFLERAQRNSETLRRLIDEVLDFTRLEREPTASGWVVADLGETVGHVLDDLAPAVDGHRLERRLPSDVWVRVDADGIRRVVANLVVNATRYSPAGTTVTVALERVGDEARLTVDDEGPGIPESDRSVVFEAFHRGRSRAVLESAGSGIGLTVVQRFVERMLGRVEIGTSPAGGAELVVWLPIVDAPSSAGGAGA